MSLAHPTRWRTRHFNKDGLLIWASGLGELGHEGIQKYNLQDMEELLREQPWDPNTVTHEGQEWILEVVFRDNINIGGGTFTGFELGLSTDAALAETDTYATRAELTDGSGYAGISVARGTGTWTAASGTEPVSTTTPSAGTHTWNATGTWSTANALILFTAGLTTNRLICFDNLSQARTLGNGDQLDVDLDVTANSS